MPVDAKEAPMQHTVPDTTWEQLRSIQQEYEGVCRKAWSLRADRDPQHQAELDREVSAVLRRAQQVLQLQPLPGWSS
jgi:hypothetical protein